MRTLRETARITAINHVRQLWNVGDAHYPLVADILARVTDAQQLHQIEEYSIQIQGETAELWKKIIARDIPDYHKKNYAPKNPKKWYEVYCKYKREQAEEIKRDEEVLRQQMAAAQKKKETNVSKIVDLRMLPKLPKDPRMHANNGGVPLKKGFKKDGPSSLNFTGGSRTKMIDGKSVLNRAFREAKEISNMTKLSRPAHHAFSRGTVAKAPNSMIQEYQNAKKPPIRILGRRPAADITAAADKAREDRLKAIASGSKPADISEVDSHQKAREDRLRAIASGARPAPSKSLKRAASEDTLTVESLSVPAKKTKSSPPTESSSSPSNRSNNSKIMSKPTPAPPSAPAPKPMARKNKSFTDVFMKRKPAVRSQGPK